MKLRTADIKDASDESLLDRLARGDEDAFLAIYRRRQRAVYRYSLHMSGDEEVAADVVQEMFIALLREAGRLDPALGTVQAWLFAVARKQVLRCLTARRRYLSLEEDSSGEPLVEGCVLEELEQTQLLERLRDLIPTLPPVYREVLVLCDMQGLAYEAAAAITGCPVGTVRSRLHRARALLAGKLKPLVGQAS
ncbi:MAG: sigma-70 family RNA polymerase sigma factor [Acidobacteria bacterium]|nr:sigma-70 family RNA polymerase sigma factor [Acidobacteriota bacterium]